MKRPDARRVYLFLSFTSSVLFATAFTAMALYEASTVGLNPFQLVLVGTTLELSVLLCEVPTGVVADVYSRRLSILAGHALIGLGFLVEGIFPHFIPILLAQVIWGVGYTFTSGATQAWLSDEIGEENANKAFLTGNRVGLAGGLVGMLAAIGLGSFTSPAVPIVVSGAGRVVLAAALIFMMKETNFKPTKPENRNTFQHMADIFRKGVRTVRARPAMVAILGVALFYGLYSEGFDRLWVKHLLERFALPVIFGHNDMAFFGFMEAASSLLSIAATRLVEKRLDLRNARAIGNLMLGITIGIAASIVTFALSPLLGLSLAVYLVIATLRSLTGPLMDAWMNQRLDSDVRATVLSMTGQVDAFGQIAVGPVIGVLANAVSVPLAISISGGLLTPALGFIARANHQPTATPAESHHEV
jgi:DHA3 family tetracycline resistance protein-like MFS transporter